MVLGIFGPPVNAASPLEDRLSAIERTYQQTNSLKMEFVQSTYVPMFEKTVTRPGRIFYEKPAKIRIEYAGEKMTHYISDGKKFWIFYPRDKKTETIPLEDSGLPAEALGFLTEMGKLRQYFTVSKNEKDGFVLKPKQKSSYKQLTCTFDADHYLEAMTIHNLSGNTSHYRFTKRRANQPLPEDLFRP